LREKGELRGFADRGTWKFKSDDVEECQRRRQPDSNPDVPLMTEEDEAGDSESTSDSDVRLMVTENVRKQLTGSSAELPIMKPGSDSDVRLVGSASQARSKKGSDSDVKLIVPKESDSDVKISDSDSDVRLASGAPRMKSADSDSDVRLALPPGSDSDVRLAVPPGSDSDVMLLGGGSSIQTASGQSGDSALLDDELAPMSPADSGIRLAGDSGIQLDRPADSGILLEGRYDSALNRMTDSNVQLGGRGKSSPRMRPQPPKTMIEDDQLGATAPMLRDDQESGRTDPEVPLLFEEDEQDLMPKNFLSAGPDTDSETSVIMFDEEETVAPAKKKRSKTDTDDVFDAIEEDELEVSDAVLGEEDELEDLEVFESEDSDFEAGVSAADFAIPGAARIAMPVEQEWGGGSIALVACSAVVLMVGAWIGADLLHTVSGNGGAVSDGPLIGMFGSLFK
jgi:hypothetical protein